MTELMKHNSLCVSARPDLSAFKLMKCVSRVRHESSRVSAVLNKSLPRLTLFYLTQISLFLTYFKTGSFNHQRQHHDCNFQLRTLTRVPMDLVSSSSESLTSRSLESMDMDNDTLSVMENSPPRSVNCALASQLGQLASTLSPARAFLSAIKYRFAFYRDVFHVSMFHVLLLDFIFPRISSRHSMHFVHYIAVRQRVTVRRNCISISFPTSLHLAWIAILCIRLKIICTLFARPCPKHVFSFSFFWRCQLPKLSI